MVTTPMLVKKEIALSILMRNLTITFMKMREDALFMTTQAMYLQSMIMLNINTIITTNMDTKNIIMITPNPIIMLNMNIMITKVDVDAQSIVMKIIDSF